MLRKAIVSTVVHVCIIVLYTKCIPAMSFAKRNNIPSDTLPGYPNNELGYTNRSMVNGVLMSVKNETKAEKITESMLDSLHDQFLDTVHGARKPKTVLHSQKATERRNSVTSHIKFPSAKNGVESDSLKTKLETSTKKGRSFLSNLLGTEISSKRSRRSSTQCDIKSYSVCPWIYNDDQEAECLTTHPVGCDPFLSLIECRKYFFRGIAVACIAVRPCIVSSDGILLPPGSACSR